MDKFERKMRERLRRHDAPDGTTKGWHSSAYHKEFEGYSEYLVEDEKGRKRVRRIYTGDWYRMNLNQKGKTLLFTELIAAELACVVLFQLCGTRNIQANKVWYMALCQAAAIVGLIWTGSGIVHMAILPEKATIVQYRRSYEAVKKGSIISMAAFGLAALAVMPIIIKCVDFLTHLMCLALYTLAMVIMLVLNRLNENIPFEQLPNDSNAPENSAIID